MFDKLKHSESGLFSLSPFFLFHRHFYKLKPILIRLATRMFGFSLKQMSKATVKVQKNWAKKSGSLNSPPPLISENALQSVCSLDITSYIKMCLFCLEISKSNPQTPPLEAESLFSLQLFIFLKTLDTYTTSFSYSLCHSLLQKSESYKLYFWIIIA